MMKKIVIIISTFVLLSSCLGTKKTTDKTSITKESEKKEINSDSTSLETVNKSINDVVTVEVPVSDPLVDSKIDEILSKLNFKKSSGDNSYKIYYDKKLRELRTEFEVGETRSKEVATNNEISHEKTFEESVAENTKKVVKMIPWWGWLIVAFALRKQIISIIAIFVPGVKGILTLQDLLNPPNKNET